MQKLHTPFSMKAMNLRKVICALTVLLFFVGATILQAQPINFSVNMEHSFLSPGDKVVIRGNIPGLGNWEHAGQLLLKKERETDIYSGKLTLKKEVVSPVLYKFVILRQDGTEEWEERGNRVLDRESQNTVWFDDRSSAGIQQTVVQVTVRLDLSKHGMDGVPAENVALLGGRSPLSYDLETGRTEMKEVSEGIWETTVTFPFGTPYDVPFKFAWKHEGEWIWEWRAGHTNHVFWIDDTSSQQVIALRYNLQKTGVIPVEGSSGMVDDYEAIMLGLGEQSTQSRYMYERSIELLEAGEMEAAKVRYAQYKEGHAGGEEIDDFHYRMAHKLSRTQGVEVAQKYIEDRLKDELISERRTYFGYLKGELLMNAGRRAEARKHFKEVLKEENWEIATEYSKQGLVHSYLMEPEPDSIKKGVRLLEQQAAQAPVNERRKYAQRLSRAYQRAGMQEERKQAMRELATTGNKAQQTKGALNLADSYLKEGRYTEALGILDVAELQEMPKGYELRNTRLRIQAYSELQMYDELLTLFTSYEQKWPDDPFYKRLKKLAERAGKNTKGFLPGPGFVTTPNDSTGNN